MTDIVFLGGMGRSGTNLLRNILDSHSNISSGPEFNHLQDIIELYRIMSVAIEEDRISSYVDHPRLRQLTAKYIDDLIGEYGRRRDTAWVVEKTPSNIWSFLELSHLFPNAKFIQVIRDGRDVCCSHREVGKRMLAKGIPLTQKRDSALLSVFYCAALWNETVKHGIQCCGPTSLLHSTGRVVTVRYEDLVSAPETVIKDVCSFLKIPFQERMLHPENVPHDTYIDEIWVQKSEAQSPISNNSVNAWVTSMTLSERVLFAAKGLEGLSLLGYRADPAWSFEGLDIEPHEARSIIAEAKNKIEILSDPTASNPVVRTALR